MQKIFKLTWLKKYEFNFYYIAFALYNIIFALHFSMLRKAIINHFSQIYSIGMQSCIFVIIGLLLLKLVSHQQYKVKELIFKGILIIIPFFIQQEQKLFFILFLFIISADGVDFKKIVKLSLWVNLISLVILIILSQFHIIEDLIYYRGDKVRHSFGTIYVTQFASRIFYLIICYLYLRGKKINLFDTLGIIVVVVGLYYFCDARLSIFTIFLALLASYIAKYGTNILRNRYICFLIKNSYWILAGIIWALSYFYHMNPFFDFFNRLLSNRLYLGNYALSIYQPNLFGQIIGENGFGGSTKLQENIYFYLDASYLRLFLIYGVIIFGIIGLIYYAMFKKGYGQKNYLYVALLMVICVTGMVDETLLFPTNIFLFSLFMNINNQNEGEKNGKIQTVD